MYMERHIRVTDKLNSSKPGEIDKVKAGKAHRRFRPKELKLRKR